MLKKKLAVEKNKKLIFQWKLPIGRQESFILNPGILPDEKKNDGENRKRLSRARDEKLYFIISGVSIKKKK